MTAEQPAANSAKAAWPVLTIPTDPAADAPEPGIGLCLSGGGYRAMLFHVGTFWRLNELGYLARLTRISSVSGGSITAGVLGQQWSRLGFDSTTGIARSFEQVFVASLRRLASQTIDVQSIVAGVFLQGAPNRVADAYRRHLFGAATLQDLPNSPRFVINATNVQSGALWRFSKPYAADYRVGKIETPRIELAMAVAASSAFPPFLSPLILNLRHTDFTPNTGLDLQRPPYTTRVLLTDGGVYDNLGLETVWKNFRTVLVSDGGGKMKEEAAPARFWPKHVLRVLSMFDNQVRSLRYRSLIDSYKTKLRAGAYWGIRTDIADYRKADALPCPFARTTELAAVPTRLAATPDVIQERLINWGYAVCDAAMRAYVDDTLPPPPGFPYSRVGV